MKYLTSQLKVEHKKEDFDCGNDILNNYLYHQASQDMKRHLSVCFVLPNSENQIIGYYALSSLSIEREMIPEEIKKRIPISYNNLPAILIGRLALDNRYKSQGLGKDLLMDALKRCCYYSTDSVG